MRELRGLTLLLMALLLVALPRARATAVSRAHAQTDRAPGEIVVKLKESAREPAAQNPDEQMMMAARNVGLTAAGMSASRVEALAALPANGAAREIISRRGLDRIFVLKYAPDADTDALIRELSASDQVEYAHPNYRVKPGSVIPDDPVFGEQWGLRNLGNVVDNNVATPEADIKAVQAWEITTGNPDLIVAVSDSGIDITHPDLAPNIYTNAREIPDNRIDDDHNGYVDDVHGYNVAEQNGDTSDVLGHGTQMAGIIAARMNNSVGISGVCQSKILPVKFFKRTGPFPDDIDATVADAARSLIYSIAAGASIINASWRTLLSVDEVSETDAQALKDAVTATLDAGILLVCIAGNEGFNNDYSKVYPGDYRQPNQIVVAASDYNDTLWHHPLDIFTIKTGFGVESVALSAPGVSVFTTLARGDCITCTSSDDPSDWYGRIDGTSASAAFVSGVAALVKTKYPSDNVMLIKQRILEGVDRRDTLSSFLITGGRLNALGALTAQPSIIPPALTSVTLTGKKLFFEGIGIKPGAVAVVGGSMTFPTTQKGSRLMAKVTKKAFPSVTPVHVKLRNPDGGTSQAFTISR
ncbi:MAG TPA: S8 family serine peptidase [Blastocatellia bacterium]|nr:S8 family serine peptidase [Blastocatellia bacterium]